MKISIITVCYNSVETIEDTINSVLSQTYPDIEYIIVDGASTDGTLEVVNRYREHIATIISEPDNGIYDAMNKGIRAATGDVIGILNSDDVYVHNRIVKMVARAVEENQVDSLYGDLCYVDRYDMKKVVRMWRSGKFNRKSFLNGWMVPHPTFFVRKSVLDQYGLYDPTFRFAGDYELILRLLYKHGVSTYYLPQVLVKMRIGGTGNRFVESRLIANLEDRLAWKKNKLKARPYTTILKPVRKIVQFIRHIPKASF